MKMHLLGDQPPALVLCIMIAVRIKRVEGLALEVSALSLNIMEQK